jgi:hypothetical protein
MYGCFWIFENESGEGKVDVGEVSDVLRQAQDSK